MKMTDTPRPQMNAHSAFFPHDQRGKPWMSPLGKPARSRPCSGRCHARATTPIGPLARSGSASLLLLLCRDVGYIVRRAGLSRSNTTGGGLPRNVGKCVMFRFVCASVRYVKYAMKPERPFSIWLCFFFSSLSVHDVSAPRIVVSQIK